MEEFINQLLTNARGIWKYRWLAAGVSWMLAVAGWAGVTALPDDYQSSARVYVDTQSILKPLLSGMTSVPNVEQQVAIMSRTLLSRPNVERVMRMADLDLEATSPREHERQLEELMGKIRIAGTGSYDIYTITYHHHDPKKVRDVVQSLLAIFVEGSFKGKKADTQKAMQFIDEQIKTYEARLVAAENTLKEFKMQNSALLPRQGVDYGAQLLLSADALGAARLDLAEAEQSRDAIRSQVDGAAADGAATPALDARIDALNKNLDGLRLQYTDLHPDIVAARRLLAQLELRRREENAAPAPRADPALLHSPVQQQLRVALTEADARVAAMRVRVRELGLRHERLQRQSKAVPEVESQLAQLNRDYDVNKENYEKLLGKREAARLSGDLSATTEMMNFRIIDPPTMPARPVGPNRPLYYSAVLAAALAAGGVAAIATSQARPTFLSAAELRAFTGLSVIGTVAMNWTPAQLARRRRDKAGLGTVLATLLLGYGGVMSYALLLE